MATLSPTSSNFIFFFSTSLLLICTASAHEFRVGGLRGWTVPTGNESETYNHWATRNRFHIGDSLYFKYENDSVLVVDREEYDHCDTSKPLFKFDDGNTTFQFDRYGFFYFISGVRGHCESGQRMIVRVMVHPEIVSPGPGLPPSPQPGSGGQGSSSGPGSGSGQPASSPGSHASSGTAAKYSAIVAALRVFLVVLLFL